LAEVPQRQGSPSKVRVPSRPQKALQEIEELFLFVKILQNEKRSCPEKSFFLADKNELSERIPTSSI
tara:strand:+ start:237 stop:437 length:201 start_codon:yes stop_codon:yes gene_type:complete